MKYEDKLQTLARIRLNLVSRDEAVKVLLVEDSENDAETTKVTLQRFGVDVFWARDAWQAQTYLEKNDPWLVLLDMKMSPADDGTMGLNILDMIKTLKPELTVFILTGHDHSAPCCLAAIRNDRPGGGADSVWSKPLTEKQTQFLFASA